MIGRAGAAGSGHLTRLSAWCDNELAMLVAEFGLHSSNCLNRHTDDAFFLPGKVQLAGFPFDLVEAFASTYSVPSLWCVGWAT